MSDVRIKVENLWKKFHRGEIHDSLRDMIPSLAKRLLGKSPSRKELGEGDFWALREMEFEVKAGEALGVIGPNGAGKSTLLKVLNRILRPNRGHMKVEGRVGALIEVSAGFHPDLTGRENIFLQGAILGMRREEIANKFDEIVAFSGIEAFIDTPVKRYSSGMNARLGFSIATSLEQDVLLIDEVLSVGDWRFQQRCNERMEELVKGGAAVIFISHNHRAIGSLCDKTMLIRSGQKAAYGPSGDVIREYLQGSTESNAGADAPVHLSRVTLSQDGTEKWDFSPGDEARVDIEVKASTQQKGLVAVLFVRNQAGHAIFNTSTNGLTDTVDLEPGESHVFSFGLEMHLARGEYHLGAALHEKATEQRIDTIFPAATVHIHSNADVGGTCQLYPKLLTD
ncbi:MAG: ABC transporter ATP-binding protein [Planctomycetota bacterium]